MQLYLFVVIHLNIILALIVDVFIYQRIPGAFTLSIAATVLFIANAFLYWFFIADAFIKELVVSKVRGYYKKSFLFQYWHSFKYLLFFGRKKRKPGETAESWKMAIGDLDQESQEKLLSASHYDHQADMAAILFTMLTLCYSILRIVIIVTSFFTAPVIVQRWLHLPSQPFTSSYFWSFIFFVSLGLFPFIIRGIFLNLFHVDLISVVIRLGGWPRSLFLCYVGILTLFTILSFKHIPYPSQYPAPIFGATELMLGLYFITWLRILYNRWCESSLFNFLVMSILVSLLGNIRDYHHEHRIDEVEYKRRQVSSLDYIAQIIEHSLSSQVPWLDSTTKDWLQKRTRRIAGAFREKEKLILIPNKDAEKYLTEKMIFAFVCILNGDWDALEQVALETSPQVTHKWGSTVLSWIKGFVLAILPIAAFLILEQTQWAIVAPIRGYVIVGLFIWALLSVMAVIDPAIGSRIAAFKDAASISNLVSSPIKGKNP